MRSSPDENEEVGALAESTQPHWKKHTRVVCRMCTRVCLRRCVGIISECVLTHPEKLARAEDSKSASKKKSKAASKALKKKRK